MSSLHKLLATLAVGFTLSFSSRESHAMPLSDQVQSWIANGRSVDVIVEVNSDSVDSSSDAERLRRHQMHDDSTILDQRRRGYRAIKQRIEKQVMAADARLMRDLEHLPLSIWRVSSLAALARLQSHGEVVAVHQNSILRPVAVSDLGFVNQPQTAQQGDIGAGTTIAVIDGGLGNNYRNYSDFGTCMAVNTPSGTCRVVVNTDSYPGASTETAHGTNVSAISLGMAPGAKLAMYNVFNGSSTTTVDVVTAINAAIGIQSTYNIVAINLSLGDGTSHSTQCNTSAFRTAINNARNAGISVVVAAGNNGSKTGLADPACAPNVISVGAVYDAAYGNVGWITNPSTNQVCSDNSVADHVTCFSQSASYLSLLAPGSFVSAPSSAFQQSGTSQAAPHISGAVAVLRAKYPFESLSQTVQRMVLTGVSDTDTAAGANNRVTPRLNLVAAANLGTAISLSGSGPVTATLGSTGAYYFTVTNTGPLAATNIVLTVNLPSGATMTSATSGCVVQSNKVICSLATLAANMSATFSINVSWNISAAVYTTASIAADQVNVTSAAQQSIALGVAATDVADAPLPMWSTVLLVLVMISVMISRQRIDIRTTANQ